MMFRKRMLDINREVSVSPPMWDTEKYMAWKIADNLKCENDRKEKLLKEKEKEPIDN